MPLFSIIIPCYNQGEFIWETINSALNQTCQNFEIIIIDDGSTDKQTINILNKIKHKQIKVYHISNGGVSQARNFGVSKASGNYILPLDSDDKIGCEYLAFAQKAFNDNPNLGIVYCKAELFGKKNGAWNLPDYSLKEMLKANAIFVSGIYKKSDFEIVGGYDLAFVKGLEDYDFWLSIIELGRDVLRLDQVLFFYRKHQKKKNSRQYRMGRFNEIDVYNQIYKKHQKLYETNIDSLFELIFELRTEKTRLMQMTFLKKMKKRLCRWFGIKAPTKNDF